MEFGGDSTTVLRYPVVRDSALLDKPAVAPSIVAELVNDRDAKKVPKGEIIQAYGYDENVMPEGRLLNRDDLDAACFQA